MSRPSQPGVPPSQRRPSTLGPSANFQAKPSQSKPKQATTKTWPKDKPRDPRDIKLHGGIEDDHQEYLQRRKPLLFTAILGVFLIAAGCPATWYGATRQLTDFLVMGPQAIIIGFILILVALVTFGRDIHRMRSYAKVREEEQEVKDVQNKKLMIEYALPEEPEDPLKVNMREPTMEDLYGTRGGGAKDLPIVDEETSSKLGGSRTSMTADGLDAEIRRIYGNKAKGLPRPSLAYPSHGGGGMNDMDSGVYTVPIKQAQIESATEHLEKKTEGVNGASASKARKTSTADQKVDKTDTQKLPNYNIPEEDLAAPIRELTVTDLYGKPDVTDFGSTPGISGLCTPATVTTEVGSMDEVDEEIEEQYKERLKEHEPPDVVHANVAHETTPL